MYTMHAWRILMKTESKPAQTGTLPLHTPTVLLPSPVQILIEFPPLGSVPSGQDIIKYRACDPNKYGDPLEE